MLAAHPIDVASRRTRSDATVIGSIIDTQQIQPNRLIDTGSPRFLATLPSSTAKWRRQDPGR
ncbi:hypothetical protein XH80_00725 [Bradyrhizobium sp. CCBAU 45384]|nr:hypothetical protein [Bradyrhizobium sp. CCBAU 45384]